MIRPVQGYSLIVFDWDGTLMDSTPTIIAAIQSACRDLGLPVPPDEAAAWVIGLSLQDALLAAVPTLEQAQVPAFVARYRFHYLTRDPQLKLFSGAEQMLAGLAERGARLAVATGKSRVGLERALDATGIRRYFDTTRCADETFSKPNPAMLFEIMRELDVDPAAAVMVGDTSHDLQMARNAGIHGVGVTYGAHAKEELAGCAPQTLVGSIGELSGWLAGRVAARAA
ncbi:HAD family hydrolase [Pigmentiphaga sp. NML080357]|uniref:HAD-IA family hydrolase n=1 Tax=Pigmentiphaga sp. NML080357 TaxID=2008675 RepID=UPI000B40F19F|nr:HAD-IA family hydrolase [Pigmentiphaga sp. NML080357]OVZ63038.1 HAD family hydrolase [Pigmentiphaga sp. NML080357]